MINFFLLGPPLPFLVVVRIESQSGRISIISGGLPTEHETGYDIDTNLTRSDLAGATLALIGSGRNRVTIREDIHHFRRITYVQKRKQIFMCICMQWTKILTSSDQCHKKLQEFWVRTDRGVSSRHKVDIFLKETKREARVPETLKLLQLQVKHIIFPLHYNIDHKLRGIPNSCTTRAPSDPKFLYSKGA